MSSKNALDLHLKMCKLVVEASADVNTSWGDLYKLLPQLRHTLACTVCGSILESPIGPADQICGHHVCLKCKGGKKRLKPSCSYCRDYQVYVHDRQMELIVEAFHRTCKYLLHTEIYEKMKSFSLNGSMSSLVELIQEGAGCDLVEKQAGVSSTNIIKSSVQKEEEDSELSANEDMVYNVNMHVATNDNSVRSDKSTPELNGEATDNFALCKDPSYPQQAVIKHSSTSSTLAVQRVQQSQVQASDSVLPRYFDDEGRFAKLGRVCVNSKNSYDNYMSSPLFIPEESSPNGKLMHKGVILKSEKKKVPKGCRCGNATPNPGKLTCCGQRCPCYAETKACVNCKCRGCRNTYKPGARKQHEHTVPTNEAIKQEAAQTCSLSLSKEVSPIPEPLASNAFMLQSSAAFVECADNEKSPVSRKSSPQQLIQTCLSTEQEGKVQGLMIVPVQDAADSQARSSHVLQSSTGHQVSTFEQQDTNVQTIVPDVIKTEMISQQSSPLRTGSTSPTITTEGADSNLQKSMCHPLIQAETSQKVHLNSVKTVRTEEPQHNSAPAHSLQLSSSQLHPCTLNPIRIGSSHPSALQVHSLRINSSHMPAAPMQSLQIGPAHQQVHLEPIRISPAHFNPAQLQLNQAHHQITSLSQVHQVIHMPQQIYHSGPVFFNTMPMTAINAGVLMAESPQTSDSIEA